MPNSLFWRKHANIQRNLRHHKAHTASKGKISVHQVAVIPETHGKILNATALKKQLKGPYGESDVIGGMMSGGY